MLFTIRYVLPAVLIAAGFVLLFAVDGSLRWDGWAMCVGAGLSVLLLNCLFRLGVAGDKERDEEAAARDFLTEHGYWPDEAPNEALDPRPQPKGLHMPESRRVIYTANAHVTGGRAQGHGRTSDGALEVDLRTPVEMGGVGGGTNPEQLFAIGYAACFESAMGVAARRRRQEIGDVAIDSKVMLLPTADRGFKLAVALAVTLPSVPDPREAAELVRAAHRVCPYSNATRGNVDVCLTANGVAIDDASEPLAA